MPRKPSPQLTPLELRIMEVLWEIGPASVQAVRQRLAADESREYAHTTIHTMLTVLVRKGKVKRTARERAHVYRASVSRSQVVKQAVRDVVDKLFGGSAANLMINVLETRGLTPEDVEQLRKKLEEMSNDAE